MHIEAGRPDCPVCGASALTRSPILHHMMCAYVGPEYDFAANATGCTCPKCLRDLVPGARDWESVGMSARCESCKSEMVQDGLA